MNSAHVHLLLNHIPVVGIFFGIVLLALALARESEELKKVSLWILVLMALIAIPVYLTGEPAEEIVEHLPGVSGAIIEQHEEAAKIAFAAIEILGVLALASLIFLRRHHRSATRLITATLILSVLVGGSIAWTANLGGQIRHSEIRSTPNAPPSGDETDQGHAPE